MAKIGIFEDDKGDLVRRYDSLSGKHEIHVYMKYGRVSVEDYEVSYLKKQLAESKFQFEKFYNRMNDVPTTLDLYFTDGLDGRCFEVADKFGKDKTHILTGDPMIQREAREQGYKLIESGFEEIIARHLNRT